MTECVIASGSRRLKRYGASVEVSLTLRSDNSSIRGLKIYMALIILESMTWLAGWPWNVAYHSISIYDRIFLQVVNQARLKTIENKIVYACWPKTNTTCVF